jgi:hypothetical protein
MNKGVNEMIFGHLGLAMLLKAKYYSKSLIFLIIFCYLPDIVFYVFFGVQWTLITDYPPIWSGLLRPILSLTGTHLSFIDYPLPLSHSIILYVLFTFILLLGFSARKRSILGLIFTVALFSHLLFDILIPDATIGVPIVYPFYPFDPAITHYVPFLAWDNAVFWLIDLSVFIFGFFTVLWAFSKKSGQEELNL